MKNLLSAAWKNSSRLKIGQFEMLVEIGLYLFLPLDSFRYWGIGGFFLLGLLLYVQKVWPHYVITFLTTVAAIITVRIGRKWDNAVGVGIYQFSSIFIIFFYVSYFSILNRRPDYTKVVTRSVVSGILGVLCAWIFIAAHRFTRQHNTSPLISYSFFCLFGFCCFLVFYGLGKKYLKANDLFRRGNILNSVYSICKLLHIKSPDASNEPEQSTVRAVRTDECECCGKTGLPQDLLFKIDSGQRVCAACLAKMDDREG